MPPGSASPAWPSALESGPHRRAGGLETKSGASAGVRGRLRLCLMSYGGAGSVALTGALDQRPPPRPVLSWAILVAWAAKVEGCQAKSRMSVTVRGREFRLFGHEQIADGVAMVAHQGGDDTAERWLIEAVGAIDIGLHVDELCDYVQRCFVGDGEVEAVGLMIDAFHQGAIWH